MHAERTVVQQEPTPDTVSVTVTSLAGNQVLADEVVLQLQDRLGHRPCQEVVFCLPGHATALEESFVPEGPKLRLQVLFKEMVSAEERDELLNFIATAESAEAVFQRMQSSSRRSRITQTWSWQLLKEMDG